MDKQLIAERLLSNGLLTKFDQPIEAVRNTVGIQAQAQRQAELNIALRSNPFPPSTLHDSTVKTATRQKSQESCSSALTALYKSQQIVRSWANRWTLHLLTYEDWELLINARQNEQLPQNYFLGQKKIGLTAIELLKEAVKTQKTLTKAEVKTLLSTELPHFDLKSYLLYAVLHSLIQQGLCYFDATQSSQSYRLIAADSFKRTSSEQAIEQLIPRYLAGFSPATLEDFVKWSGLKISSVRKIWQRSHVDEAPTFDPALSDLLREKTIIAAGFDSLLTGYADKTWLTPADKISELWSKNGILYAPIIYDGQLVGKWNYKIAGHTVSFQVRSWEAFDRSQLEEKLSEVADFLQKKIAKIEVAD